MRRRPGRFPAICEHDYISCMSYSPQPGTFSVLGWFILGRYFRVYCPNRSTAPAKPRRPGERPAAPNIGAEHLVLWNRPVGTHLEYPHRCRQSSVHPARQFIHHVVRGLRRGVGETVDPVLYLGNHMGEHRRSREGIPGQTRGT